MVWEYKIVYFGLDVEPPQVMEEDEYEERLLRSEQMLNEMGRERWELVSFLSHTTNLNITKFHAVMRRPKSS